MKNFIFFLAVLMCVSCGGDNSEVQNEQNNQNKQNDQNEQVEHILFSYQGFAYDRKGGSKLKEIQTFKNKKSFEAAFSKRLPNKKPPIIDFKRNMVLYISNGLSQFNYDYSYLGHSQEQKNQVERIKSIISNCNTPSTEKKSSFHFLAMPSGAFEMIEESVTACDPTNTEVQNISFSTLHSSSDGLNMMYPDSVSKLKGKHYELINDSVRFAEIYPQAIPDVDFNESSVLFLQSGTSTSHTQFSVEKIEKVDDKIYVYTQSEFLDSHCPTNGHAVTPTLFIKIPKSENVFFKDRYQIRYCNEE